MKIRKNGKVVNLTESDLRRIVKRVLNESTTKSMKLALYHYGKFVTNLDCEMEELRGNIIDFTWKVAGDGIAYVYGAKKGWGYPSKEQGKVIDGALTIKEGYGMLKCDPQNKLGNKMWSFSIFVKKDKDGDHTKDLTANYEAFLSDKGRALVQQTFCDKYSSTDTEQDDLEMGGGYA